MWSCWQIFFTTWLLDSVFLYIAASNCSVNIAKSMSERGDTVVGLSLERSGPDHKQLKLSNGQRSHGTKYAKILRMNIQVNSYLHPLEPNPPLLDTVFQKNIPSLTILESTFQVFFAASQWKHDCGLWSLEGSGRSSWVAKIPAVTWSNWLVERLIHLKSLFFRCPILSRAKISRVQQISIQRITWIWQRENVPFGGNPNPKISQRLDSMMPCWPIRTKNSLRLPQDGDHPNFLLNKDFIGEILS